MDNQRINAIFSDLSTPHVADACVRLGIPLRSAPAGIHPLTVNSRIAGHAQPARHYGSVDIFLEAMESAQPGDILVIDNSGRMDEACIGDLTALEAKACGLAGFVVWGCHRDTAELVRIGFPVFGYGTCSAGPTRLDPREDAALRSARFGQCEVGKDDIVFADDDGVLFVAAQHLEEVLANACAIWQTERKQAAAVTTGRTLREQLHFRDYLVKRAGDPTYTFRRHLRTLRGAIEE
ncbi:MAG: RraA family protein [Deltaproteobacteria bacterium]|nr:RraA family protein [Deltaproteobacteria bacterium]